MFHVSYFKLQEPMLMALNAKILYITIAVLFIAVLFFAFGGGSPSQTQTASVGKPAACVKSNSCKSRTVGSGFRCDKEDNFVGTGEYWCECSEKCEVERHKFPNP